MTDVFIHLPKLQVKEGSSFNATAYFRNGDVAEAPGSAKYRIDCLTTCRVLVDWTALLPGGSISIPVTAENNAIQRGGYGYSGVSRCGGGQRTEQKQLTVSADPDTPAQTRDSAIWEVVNIYGF